LVDLRKKDALTLTEEDKRMKAMNEIFRFYAKQNLPNGLPFDKLEESKNQLDTVEFMKFCKDFKIYLQKPVRK
jgi:hypothetical protein